MTMIALYRGPYAPTGYIVCLALPDGNGQYDWDETGEAAAKILFTAEERREMQEADPNVFSDKFTRLIQTDWDFPGVATSFGWSVASIQRKGRTRCEHRSTDGTVNCAECGLTVTNFIASAREYLDNCADDAKVVEDPGYFSED